MGRKLYAKGEGFNPTTGIDDVEGLREELDALKGGSGGGGGDTTAIERRLTTAEGEIDALQGDVAAQSEEIAAQSEEIAAVGAKVNTLQGTDTGKSVRTIAAEETAKIVGGAPANYDTLKEIADYISSDAEGAAELRNKVNKNATDIADLQELTEAIVKVNAQQDTALGTKASKTEAQGYATTAKNEAIAAAAADAQAKANTAESNANYYTDGAVEDLAKGQVAINTDAIASLQTAQTSLSATVKTNTNNIATHTQQIANLDSNKLGKTEKAADSAKADVASAMKVLGGEITDATEGAGVMLSNPNILHIGNLPADDSANIVMNLNAYTGKTYIHQIAFTSRGFFWRQVRNKALDATTPWSQIAFTSDLEDYLPLTGGTVSGTLSVSSILRMSDLEGTYKIILQRDSSGNILFGGGFLTNNMYIDADVLRIRANQTIFSHNVTAPKFIGSLEGNASSATKLITPRNLWGQSFDGSKDINGVLNITGETGYSEGIRIHPVDGLASIWLCAINNKNYDAGMWGITAMQGGNLRFRGGASAATDLMVITQGGNVGIGTTTPTEKLDVAGNIKASGMLTTGSDAHIGGEVVADGGITSTGDIDASGNNIKGNLSGTIDRVANTGDNATPIHILGLPTENNNQPLIDTGVTVEGGVITANSFKTAGTVDAETVDAATLKGNLVGTIKAVMRNTNLFLLGFAQEAGAAAKPYVTTQVSVNNGVLTIKGLRVEGDVEITGNTVIGGRITSAASYQSSPISTTSEEGVPTTEEQLRSQISSLEERIAALEQLIAQNNG